MFVKPNFQNTDGGKVKRHLIKRTENKLSELNRDFTLFLRLVLIDGTSTVMLIKNQNERLWN